MGHQSKKHALCPKRNQNKHRSGTRARGLWMCRKHPTDREKKTSTFTDALTRTTRFICGSTWTLKDHVSHWKLAFLALVECSAAFIQFWTQIKSWRVWLKQVGRSKPHASAATSTLGRGRAIQVVWQRTWRRKIVRCFAILQLRRCSVCWQAASLAAYVAVAGLFADGDSWWPRNIGFGAAAQRTLRLKSGVLFVVATRQKGLTHLAAENPK